MTQTVPATAVLGPGKTGLTIGYRVLNLDGTTYAAFSTTGVTETSAAGTYRKTGGVVAPRAGGYIVWGEAATDYAEDEISPAFGYTGSATGTGKYYDDLIDDMPQVTRDAMKLAPTAGDPAAGSLDKHLDDLLTSTAAIDNSGTYSYSNTVDDGSGNLLDGVYIQLATDSGFTNVVTVTHSNASGAFTVRSDQSGTHYLRLQLAGYSFTDQTVTLA